MNSSLLLLAEFLLSVTMTLVVLRVLSTPLTKVLERVCPDIPAAAFWMSYTKVMLTIAPLLLVLTVDMLTHFSHPMDSLRLALMATLAGLLIGLYSIGKRLGQFVTIPQQSGRQ